MKEPKAKVTRKRAPKKVTRDRVPALVAQRRKISAEEGDHVTIKVFPINFDPVTEDRPITYTWKQNGGVIEETTDKHEFVMEAIHEGDYEITASQAHESGVGFSAKTICKVSIADDVEFSQYHVDSFWEHIIELFKGTRARVAPIVRETDTKKAVSYTWFKGADVIEDEHEAFLEINAIDENKDVEFKCEVTYSDGTKARTEKGLEISIIEASLPDEITDIVFESVFVPEHNFSVLSLPAHYIDMIDGLIVHTNVADQFDNVLIETIKEDAAIGDPVSTFNAQILYSFYHSLTTSAGQLYVTDHRDGYASLYTPAMGRFDSFLNPENIDRVYTYKHGSVSYTRRPNVLNWNQA